MSSREERLERLKEEGRVEHSLSVCSMVVAGFSEVWGVDRVWVALEGLAVDPRCLRSGVRRDEVVRC